MKTNRRTSKRRAILDSDDISDENIDVCQTDTPSTNSYSHSSSSVPLPNSLTLPPPLKIPFNPVSFGGRLSEKESLQITPTPSDRKLFEKSLQMAQYKNPHLTLEQFPPLPPPPQPALHQPTSVVLSMPSISSPIFHQHRGRGRPPKNAASLNNHKRTIQNTSLPTFNTTTNKPSVETLYLGPHVLKPWYSSPFPAEYIQNKPNHKNTLYMCERCLKYLRSKPCLLDHMSNCPWIDGPPGGREICRQSFNPQPSPDTATAEFILMVYELDGRDGKAIEYCKRLCLLAKMFLDHKTLYYDVETFLFYVLVEYIPSTKCWSLCGYFSKEKMSPGEHNLSCIMTLPHQQKKGFGHFLIDLSYCLTRIEQSFIRKLISADYDGDDGDRDHHHHLNEDLTTLRLSILASVPEGRSPELHILGGTPEKPLSDLGLMSYSSYWRKVILRWLYVALKQKGVCGGDDDVHDDDDVHGATTKITTTTKKQTQTTTTTQTTKQSDLSERPMISRLNLAQMSRDTGMTVGDVLGTLEHLQAVSWNPDDSEKGCIEVCIGVQSLCEQVKRIFQKDTKTTLWVDRRSLIWSPYLSWKG